MKIDRKPFADLIQDRLENRIPPGKLIVNQEGSKATIRIYDEIGFFGITGQDVADELDEITADEIEVQIASIGGSVFDAVAIYNALRSHSARITTRVDSMAASSASIIAQAGDERIMLSGSQMMIHQAFAFTMGGSADHRKTADILDKQSDIIAGIYAERADGTPEEFRALMDDETWFDADGAVEAGLADKVVKPSSEDDPEARWRPNKFSDQLEAVVTAVEQVAEETENVVTFRSEQGKPPLSDDAVASMERLADAASRLVKAAEPTDEPPEEAEITDEANVEFARFVKTTV